MQPLCPGGSLTRTRRSGIDMCPVTAIDAVAGIAGCSSIHRTEDLGYVSVCCANRRPVELRVAGSAVRPPPDWHGAGDIAEVDRRSRAVGGPMARGVTRFCHCRREE